jgi:pimeloyl-ACP methyl ester carboxylesterase
VRTAADGIKGLERLDAPVLLIRGRSTAPWLHRVVDVLNDTLPDANVVDLNGGHACILEDPTAFVAALTEHIDNRQTGL